MATITVRPLTGGNNNHPEPVFTASALQTDFIAAGVVGAITLNTGSGGTGAFAVNAQGSPNMTVRVNGPAVAYVTATPTGSVSQLLRVDMNTFQDVTISANASGSTKYDWIYIKIDPDLALNPDTSATTVGTIVTSRSSSNSSDNGTPPTYGYNLGYVTVANGASSITNSNIADNRTRTGANTLDTSSTNYNSVTAPMLATNAITLASVSSSTSQGSISGSDVILTGLTTTVTIPAGGRKVRIEVLCPWVSSTIAAHATLSIYNSATVTGSAIQSGVTLIATAGTKTSGYLFYEYTPAAGPQSYCASIAVDSGTGSTTLTATRQAWLTVRLV